MDGEWEMEGNSKSVLMIQNTTTPQYELSQWCGFGGRATVLASNRWQMGSGRETCLKIIIYQSASLSVFRNLHANLF